MEILETLEKNYVRYGRSIINVIVDHNGDAWFKANDTTKALGYKNEREATRIHVQRRDKISFRDIKSKNKGTMQPHTLFINEAGLYSLMLRSNLPKAKKFANWITHEVLPSIRKYGTYKLKKEYEQERLDIMKKINYLEKENIKIKKDLKCEKYPKGGLVYVINYSDEGENVFRIGMTADMNLRKRIYDTHSLHKRDVVLMHKTENPIVLESCIRAILYENRYKNKKDFYICSFRKIKAAFDMCIDNLKNIRNVNQKGGLIEDSLDTLKNKKDQLKSRINRLNKYIEQ